MNYTIYDETGLILYHVTSSTGLDTTHYEGRVIEGIYPNDEYYIKDGGAVKYPHKPSEFHVWSVIETSWIVTATSITSAVDFKLTELKSSCELEILSGFSSSALGEEHHYPAKTIDQANLNASVTASMYPNLPPDWTTPFWCEKDGEWLYKLHTAAQIQQVGLDGKNTILACLAKNEGLQTLLKACTTLEQIQGINW